MSHGSVRCLSPKVTAAIILSQGHVRSLCFGDNTVLISPDVFILLQRVMLAHSLTPLD